MDAINLGTRCLIVHGGSQCLTIPPVALENTGKPSRFQVMLHPDRSIRLIPIPLFLGFVNIVITMSTLGVGLN